MRLTVGNRYELNIVAIMVSAGELQKGVGERQWPRLWSIFKSTLVNQNQGQDPTSSTCV